MPPTLSKRLEPRYVLRSLLGRGAVGEVWAAHDRWRDEEVALKLLRCDGGKSLNEEDLEALLAEVQGTASLRHPSVVRIRDTHLDETPPCFTMERLHGVSFEDVLSTRPSDADELAAIERLLAEILAALDYVHTEGTIHGDLKPSNIFLVTGDSSVAATEPLRDPTSHIRLIDFGLARQRGSSFDPSATAGTPLYMAPEQLAGREITAGSDLYSLGAVLYHVLTGRPPFESLNAALTRSPAPPPPRELSSSCPAHLEDLVLSLLENEPDRRPASAAAISRTLTESPRLLRPTFVGRAKELSTLEEACRRVHSSSEPHGEVVVVEGPKSSGKSWLLRESSILIEARLHAGTQAFVTTLRQRGLVSQLRSLEASLAELTVAEIADSGGDLVSETTVAREQLLREGLRIVEDATRHAPLCLVVEDAEHATELDVDLLARISRRVSTLPIVLIVSRRTDAAEEVSQLQDWLRELDRQPHAQTIRLSGLSDGGIREYVRAILTPHAEVDDSLVEEIAEKTDTRPLSVHSCLATLLRQGRIQLVDDRWHAIGAPTVASPSSSVTNLPEHSPDEHRVLTAIHVLGSPCTTQDACDLAESPTLSRPAALTTLRRLVGSGRLIETPDGIEVSPESEYEPVEISAPEVPVGKDEIRRLHERAAERILERGTALGEDGHARLARHFSESGDSAAAARHMIAAARIAAHAFANRRARRAFEAALEILESTSEKAADVDELARANLDLGTLYVRVGEYDRALERFRICESLEAESGESIASLRDRIGRVLHRQGELEEARRYYERSAEDAANDAEARGLAEYRLGSIAFDTHEFENAFEHFEQSLETYGDDASPEHLIPVHLGLGLVEKSRGDSVRAIGSFERALEAARASGQLVDEARILGNLGNLYRAEGETERAVEYLELSTKTRELVGDRQGLAICFNNMSRIHSKRGHFRLAHEATERSLAAFREIGDKKGILIAQCNLGEVALALGRVESARESLLEGLELSEELGVTRMTENYLSNLSAVECTAGNFDRAIELGRRCLRSIPDGQLAELCAEVSTSIAEAFIDSDRLEEASDAITDALRFVEDLSHYDYHAKLASVRMKLARLRGDASEAVRIGRDALREPHGSDEPYGIAHLELELGIAYRDLGPDWADRTEKHLTRAQRSFDAMGCPLESARTRIEQAIYWQFVEEHDISAECVQESEATLEQVRSASEARTTDWIDGYSQKLRAHLEAGTT